jgi:hypothetical protein
VELVRAVRHFGRRCLTTVARSHFGGRALAIAKLPKRPVLHSRVRAAYWAALDGATCPEDAEHGLRVLVGELAGDFPTAAACLADDLEALTVHLR